MVSSTPTSAVAAELTADEEALADSMSAGSTEQAKPMIAKADSRTTLLVTDMP